MPPTNPCVWLRPAALAPALACALATLAPAQNPPLVLPALRADLVCAYDFEHPLAGDNAQETDTGPSATPIRLVNGGAAMRTLDGAYPASVRSLQTAQLNPTLAGQDDWKAGLYTAGGAPTLAPFASTRGITLMGWVKPTGTNPTLASATPDPADRYNAIGLFGLLSGTSDGHAVRALVEVLPVNGTLKLIALGRRLDAGNSLTLAATAPWEELLPPDTWTHLAATFDFDAGTMALYRNGVLLAATYTTTSDVWSVLGGTEPDTTSPTAPAGIKIGGSFPQNTEERNTFNGRFDDLLFFNRALTPAEIHAQHAAYLATTAPIPTLTITRGATPGELILAWTPPIAGYALEHTADLATATWQPVATAPTATDDTLTVTVPAPTDRAFFRLRKP